MVLTLQIGRGRGTTRCPGRFILDVTGRVYTPKVAHVRGVSRPTGKP